MIYHDTDLDLVQPEPPAVVDELLDVADDDFECDHGRPFMKCRLCITDVCAELGTAPELWFALGGAA